MHPWLLEHEVEAVGDGLSIACVGQRAHLRIHVTARDSVPGQTDGQDAQVPMEPVVQAGEKAAGGVGAPGESASGRRGGVEEVAWTEVSRSLEHWTVELRGPSIISGQVRPNLAVPGVYDVHYLVYEPGDYLLSMVLHYAQGRGLAEPGVTAGGQEDVIEYLVPGSPFAVHVSPDYSCAANASSAASQARPGQLPVTAGHVGGGGMRVEYKPYDAVVARKVCSGGEAASASGRWISRRLICACGAEGASGARGGRGTCAVGAEGALEDLGEAGVGAGERYARHCDFADPHDDWVWAPLECVMVRRSPLEAQACLEDAGRRVLFAGASPQRTLFFDVADIVQPGEIVAEKAHQDLEFPPSAFFHWVPYKTQAVAGCPLACELDYANITWHIEHYINQTSLHPGGADVIVVQAGIHDIFFGTLRTYYRNIPQLAALLSRLHRRARIRVLFRVGDMIHLPRGGDLSLVEHGFRSQRMLAALAVAHRVMIEAGVPVLNTLDLTLPRPEGTADGCSQAPVRTRVDAPLPVVRVGIACPYRDGCVVCRQVPLQ